MKRTLKIAAWVFGGLFIAILLAAGGATIWLRGSLPVHSGDLTAAGLSASVSIARDAQGIPHIGAANAEDAYFALGYVHAQDRLWQMEATRRLGTGRLAEIAGERFVSQDLLMRTLGIGRLAEAALARLPPEVRRAVDSYAKGVNAWIDHRKGALPPEFTLLLTAPEPWRPADSLIWGRIMALSLSGNWRRQLNQARLTQSLDTGTIDRLFPPYPVDAPVTIAAADLRAASRATANDAAAAASDVLDRTLAPLLDALAGALPPPPEAETASNSWVVAGARTRSGKPLLANDPHLGLRAPNVWYLARIDTPGLTVAGATAPGVPFHVLGHNGTIAWGMTTTGADTQDLVIERLAPDDPARYLAPDGPRAFETREEIVKVRGASDIRVRLRATRNGPVVSDLSKDVARQAGSNGVVSLRSPVLAADDATAEALYRINRARNWSEFTAALERFHAPVQNLFYADTAGHIGFSVAGRIPLRDRRDARLPADGTRADHDWSGFIPAARLPRGLDPARGYFANANNRVVGPGYPHPIARDWEPPYRARRLEQLLNESGPHDIGRSRAIQTDIVSQAARELLPLMLRLTPRDATIAPLLDRLASWDGRAARDRPEPLIFTAWTGALARALFADEDGAVAEAAGRVRPLAIERILLADAAWCDDKATAPVEACGTILARSLAAAYADLTRAFGTDIAAWRWGDAHRMVMRNAALDWLPLLGPRTRVVIATDGDDFTLNRGTPGTQRRRGGFEHVHGATLRAIYDLADLDASLFAMPGGQSGNPLSPHYRDLTTPWRDGEYVRIPAKPVEPSGRLTLRPAPPRGR